MIAKRQSALTLKKQLLKFVLQRLLKIKFTQLLNGKIILEKGVANPVMRLLLTFSRGTTSTWQLHLRLYKLQYQTKKTSEHLLPSIF